MRRMAALLSGIVLMCAVVVSCSGGAPANESGPDAIGRSSLVIAVPVDYESQIPGALLVAESIREFAGELSDVPVRCVVPSSLAPTIADRKGEFAALDVEVSVVDVPEQAFNFILGAKPFLAARAEEDADGADFLAILAPNTIVLQPPADFMLPEGVALGFSTVHHQNIGSAASEPLDDFWSRLYEVLAVSSERVFTNETLADMETVRFYFNAGSFVVRPEARLLKDWAKAFQELIDDQAMAEMCASGPRNVFLHQAALAGAALTKMQPSETVRLPDTYSYPLFFERFHGGLLTFDSLKGVVTMRYEFRIEDLPEDWQHEVSGPAEVIAWISERLARADA